MDALFRELRFDALSREFRFGALSREFRLDTLFRAGFAATPHHGIETGVSRLRVGWYGARLTARRQGLRSLCRCYGGATREHGNGRRVVGR